MATDSAFCAYDIAHHAGALGKFNHGYNIRARGIQAAARGRMTV
jgi:hypothetical protein